MNLHCAESCDGHPLRAQKGQKAGVHEGPGGRWPVPQAGASLLVGGSQCPPRGQRRLMQGVRGWDAGKAPNAHAEGSVFVLYRIKYIYTFICLMLFIYAKKTKKVSSITLEKFANAVLITECRCARSAGVPDYTVCPKKGEN